MNKKGFSAGRLFKSFGYAFRGICRMIVREQNARIHLAVLLCVIVAGCCFHLSATEWLAVVIVAGNVFAAELFNTSIERLSDTVSPQYDENIKQVKDFAAGAVLVAAILSAVVGLIIFVPKVMALF
jgi:diacylglycerol kinase (ATP)